MKQYEMRKLQSDLKKSAKETSTAASTVPTPAQSNAVSNIINGNAQSQALQGSAAQTSNTLNYQSGSGRLSVPTQGELGTPGLVSSIVSTLPSNSSGAIDASNIPTSPSAASLNSPNAVQAGISNAAQAGISNQAGTVANTSNAVSHQAQRVFSTTQTNPSANSAQTNLSAGLPSNLPAAEIKPVETIQPGSIPTSVNGVNPAPAQQAIANLSTIPENDYYQQGFGLLKESKHDQAVMVFKKQIQQYPQGELADDAYYWIAESLYVSRKLDLSKENFRAIIQGYSSSERAPDAMLKLAYIEQEQGNIIESRILLQEVIQFYPQSDAALSAKNRLSQIN